jgi:hypothetical protein
MIVKRNVTGTESAAYIRSQLQMSGKALSNLLIKLDIERGYVYSIVPGEAPESKLYTFNSGGLYPVDLPAKPGPALVPIQNDSRTTLIEAMTLYLQRAERTCCIFEEPVGSPSDQWVKNTGIDYVRIGDQMFYFFDKANFQALEKAFLRSEGYYFLCVLSSITEENDYSHSSHGEITTEFLEVIVNNISAFFVSAYDHEGYLVWSKEGDVDFIKEE